MREITTRTRPSVRLLGLVDARLLEFFSEFTEPCGLRLFYVNLWAILSLLHLLLSACWTMEASACPLLGVNLRIASIYNPYEFPYLLTANGHYACRIWHCLQPCM